MITSKAVRAVALAIGISAIGAACSGSSPSADKAQGQGQNGDSEFGLTEAEIVQRVDGVEAAIATCMTDAGFEYLPVDYPTARQAMDSNSKPSGLDPDQFRQELGYGISTLFAGAATQATSGLGERNLRIRDALSTTDRVAWERQLFGENPNQTFVVGLDSEDLSQTGGCTRAAVEATFSSDELGPGFVNYQNAEGARVDQDPRVIAAYRDWTTCMRDAGFSYAAADEIDVDLSTRLDAITADEDPAGLSTGAQSALTQLQGEERAIAAADHDCELKFVADVKTQVQTELLGPDATR